MKRIFSLLSALAIPAALLVIATSSNRGALSVHAQGNQGVRPAITESQLAGAWQATVVGQGACGFGTKLVTFTLNSAGEATNAVWSYHTVGCGDSKVTGQTFKITSLKSDGAGTATLTLGPGTKLTFSIQVAPNQQVFNLVDFTDANDYEEGVAIKQ